MLERLLISVSLCSYVFALFAFAFTFRYKGGYFLILVLDEVHDLLEKLLGTPMQF